VVRVVARGPFRRRERSVCRKGLVLLVVVLMLEVRCAWVVCWWGSWRASECCGPGGFESECQLGPTDTHSHLLSKSVDREEGPCNNDHSQLALEPFGLVTVRRSHQSLVDSATTANTFDRTPVHAIKMVGKKSGRALFKEEGTINSSSLPLQLVAHS